MVIEAKAEISEESFNGISYQMTAGAPILTFPHRGEGTWLDVP